MIELGWGTRIPQATQSGEKKKKKLIEGAKGESTFGQKDISCYDKF